MLQFAGRLPREAKRRARRYTAPYINRATNTLHHAKERILDAIYSAGTFTIKSCLVMFFLIGIFIWLLLSATATYSFIYWIYMPTIFHNLPIHFDFSGESPVAMVSLVSKQWTYSDYTLTLIQPSDDRYRLLYGGQSYSIFVDMRIPDSPSNYDMGMMNIKMDLLTHAPELSSEPSDLHNNNGNGNGNGHATNDQTTTDTGPTIPSSSSSHASSSSNGNRQAALYTPSTSQAALTRELSTRAMLATSTRPFVTEYRSSIVRWISTIIWAAPLLTGLTTESQTISVQLFEDYSELPAARCSAVRVTLLPRGRLSGDNNQFQVYSASLRFVAELRGIKYFAYYWFFTSATIWISFILGFELIIISIVGWYVYARCFAAAVDDGTAAAAAAAAGAANGGNGAPMNGNGGNDNGYADVDGFEDDYDHGNYHEIVNDERRANQANGQHDHMRHHARSIAPRFVQRRQRRTPPVAAQPEYHDDDDNNGGGDEWRIVNDDHNHDDDWEGSDEHHSDHNHDDSNDDGDDHHIYADDRTPPAAAAGPGLRHRHPSPPPPPPPPPPPRQQTPSRGDGSSGSRKKRSTSSASASSSPIPPPVDVAALAPSLRRAATLPTNNNNNNNNASTSSNTRGVERKRSSTDKKDTTSTSSSGRRSKNNIQHTSPARTATAAASTTATTTVIATTPLEQPGNAE